MEAFKQRIVLSLDKYGINSSLSMQNLKNIVADLTNKSSQGRSDLKEVLNLKKPFINISPQKS